jgi:hypothetical protein
MDKIATALSGAAAALYMVILPEDYRIFAGGNKPSIGERSGLPTSDNRTVDREDQHGADNRADKAGALAGAIPTDVLPEPSGENRADDAQQRRNNEPARPANEKLGDRAGQEADNDDPE